ncbi:hypothetical protein B0H34DRAFT_677349 [Crassisporium funariophilum]|nr:hypothetical protein B0H34DRAFT_677349 [Crassisporium funariophilum]
MLSKVTNRVKKRSAQQTTLNEQSLETAPDLVRWSDFANPFKPVSPGGYTKYYQAFTRPESSSSPSYCPFLSQCPESSSSREAPPPQSPLFFSLPKRRLNVIREASLETMAPKKPRNLTISTNVTPLRRRRRRLLRTPSIERDFGLSPKHLFASDASSSGHSARSSMDTASSHGSRSSSQASSDSHSSQSDANHSEFPLTPTTSVESGDEHEVFSGGVLFKKGSGEIRPELVERPDSWASYCTARNTLYDIGGGLSGIFTTTAAFLVIYPYGDFISNTRMSQRSFSTSNSIH